METISYFAKGLKAVIYQNFPSQKEFADGVTSPVNLSNILRGKVGTSEKMEQKLSKKAGMTVEQVINIGKKRSGITETLPKTNNPELPQDEEISLMSASELSVLVHEHNMELINFGMAYAKTTSKLIEGLIADRESYP